MRPQLDVGATLGEAFSLYREQAGVLMPLAFWLFLVVAVSNGLTQGSFSLSWVSQVLGLIVGALYGGVVVSLVRDLREGHRTPSAGDLMRRALPLLGPLVGEGFIYSFGVLVGSFLLLVPGLYLGTIWAVAVPVIVIERLGVFDALGRSRQLVKGNGWRVFGTILLMGVIGLLSYLGFLAVSAAIVEGPIVFAVFSALSATIIAPFGGLVVAVLYFRLSALEQPGDGLG